MVTPLRLFELFFDDVLVDIIFGYTKLYSYREKVDISFETINEKICLFSSILLSGCHNLPDRKMYWKANPMLLCKHGLIECLVIRSSVFFGILRFRVFELRNRVTKPSYVKGRHSWSYQLHFVKY